MNRLMIMGALCLTGCAAPRPEPVVPESLLRPVVVECAVGDTLRALGSCALALRAGLDEANAQIGAVAEILGDVQ
jgi:hypothetical protein